MISMQFIPYVKRGYIGDRFDLVAETTTSLLLINSIALAMLAPHISALFFANVASAKPSMIVEKNILRIASFRRQK